MSGRRRLRLFSWNVNGLRAAARKGFLDWLADARPHVLAVQEVRADPGQLPEEVRAPGGYQVHFHAAHRRGYSGVALYTRVAPRQVECGPLGRAGFDHEGRLIVADYGDFLLYNGYFPNGGRDLGRVPYKLEFSEAVLQHAERARRLGHGVVICGDLNTAHRSIDLANPRSNRNNTGFLPEERAWIDRLLAHGYVDVLRRLHPDESGIYTWWSNRKGVRERNVGWRIDYFFVSSELERRVVDARVHSRVMGSDHCPVELVLER